MGRKESNQTNKNILVFSEGQGTEWGIFFWVAKISNIFLGELEVPDVLRKMIQPLKLKVLDM